MPRHFLPRPGLHAALDRGADVPLTVVVGVPGAGKTVLLSSWLRERSFPSAVWMSCDARDEDSATFWLALATALRRRWPDQWLDVFDLLADDDPDLDDVAVVTVNELVDLGEPVVLVIDDVQLARSSAPSLTNFVERLPDGVRIVMGSRTEPPLALHRLRAHGQVMEMRDAELRLTTDEVSELVGAFGLSLAAGETEVLEQRTEGWVAGVQMAAVSLRDRSDPSRFLADLAKTRRSITEFLSSEVLDRQPPDINDFLFETAVLDVFDAETCNGVTGRSDAAAMLTRLEELNLFLVALNDGAYRYHDLFRDLVRYRLKAEDLEREQELHRLAASWFTQHGDLELAFHHLVAAGDEEDAFQLLRTAIVPTFYRDGGRALDRLLASVDVRAAAADSERMAHLALALVLNGRIDDADRWINRADASDGATADATAARLEFARGFVATMRGDTAGAETAWAASAALGGGNDDDVVATLPTLMARTRLWADDVSGARRICAQPDQPGLPSAYRAVGMTSALAWVACVDGALGEAKELADRVIANAAEAGVEGHPSTTDALRARGRVAFERGDFAVAESALEASLSIVERTRPPQALLSQLSLARLWLALSRSIDAMDAVRHARGWLPEGSRSPLLDLCTALEARIALDSGDRGRAGKLVDELGTSHRATVLQARIALAEGDTAHAAALIRSLDPLTERQRLDAAVLAARVAHLEASDGAEAAHEHALDFARREGFVVVVTDDMPELAGQTARLLRARASTWFEEAVFDRLERTILDDASGPQVAFEPLSDREQVVLRYLGSRLTRPEIANEMFISVNTLKTHVKAVYRKLGVSSRADALAEARRLSMR